MEHHGSTFHDTPCNKLLQQRWINLLLCPSKPVESRKRRDNRKSHNLCLHINWCLVIQAIGCSPEWQNPYLSTKDLLGTNALTSFAFPFVTNKKMFCIIDVRSSQFNFPSTPSLIDGDSQWQQIINVDSEPLKNAFNDVLGASSIATFG